jgi:hypothetical protein
LPVSGGLAIMALLGWSQSQGLLQSPIQNVKKGPWKKFLRLFGFCFVLDVTGAFWSQSVPVNGSDVGDNDEKDFLTQTSFHLPAFSVLKFSKQKTSTPYQTTNLNDNFKCTENLRIWNL